MKRPRYTMLRYSGSKAGVMEQIAPHFDFEDSPDTVFYDVFTGSGSVAVAVAEQYANVRIVMNDYDQEVYALHKVIAEGTDDEFENLLRRLKAVTLLSAGEVLRMREDILLSSTEDFADLAFRGALMNRTADSRSSGRRPLGGKTQSKNSVFSRYNYDNLEAHMRYRRELLRGRTTVTGNDFRVTLSQAATEPHAFVYCDPVYPIVGNDLYENTPEWTGRDHRGLRKMLFAMDNGWLLSYNDHPYIRDLYSECDIHPVRMPKNSQGGEKIELLIKPRR